MKRIILACFVLIAFGCSSDDSVSDIQDGNNGNGNGGNNNVNANKQPTGSSSSDLLSDDVFNSMTLEVVYVDGFQPTQVAIDNLVEFINDRSFKPGGINVELRSIPSPGNSPYTIEDIVEIEDNNRTKFNTSNTIAVWVFFTDGNSSSDSGNSVVLGTAYRNTSFVIYEETIQNISGSPLQPSRSVVESTVLLHEFGHIYGLTNLGAPLQSDHEDTDNPKHCEEENCLMYFQAETGSGIMNMISGGNIPQLDAQCIADLQANGGK